MAAPAIYNMGAVGAPRVLYCRVGAKFEVTPMACGTCILDAILFLFLAKRYSFMIRSFSIAHQSAVDKTISFLVFQRTVK